MSARGTFENQAHIESQCSNNTGNIKKHISEKSTQTEFYCNEQKSDSQIFNIHIHLPAYKVSELTGIPKIQPEVHIHFDGLITKLNTSKRNQNEVPTNDEVRNLSSPKFGDVQFHNKKKFKQSSKKGCDITIRVPRASINDSIGDNQNVDGITENVQSDNICKVVKCSETNVSSSIPNNNISKIRSDHQEPLNQTLYKNVCLKKPIVLVKDICKTKAYKTLSGGTVKNLDKLNKNESCDDEFYEQNEKNQDAVKFKNQSFSFKVENESFSTELFSPNSPNCSEKSSFSNASGETSHFQTEYINSRSKREGKSLTELAEGCNFSEILSRFKLKKSKGSFEDFIKSYDGTIKTESKSTLKNNEEPNKKREEHFLEEIKNNTAASTLKILVQHSTENCNSDILPSAGLSSVYGSYTDDDNHVGSKLLPEMTESNTVSTTYSSALNIPESNSNSNSSDFQCSDVELELIRKKMQKKLSSSSTKGEKSSKSNKKELDAESAPSPAPKKIKLSNEGSENSHNSTKTPSMEENYIPLRVSGPTKFAVASLNNVKPYKTHDAKNFKSEILFGNRVSRCSEPSLRIYKLNKNQKDATRPNYS